MGITKNNSIYKWVRTLHRDIGFFLIGLTVIYCVSGILLTLRDTDFLKSDRLIEKTIDSGLTGNKLLETLHLRREKIVSENQNEITFTTGTYNKVSGDVSYRSQELPSMLQGLNALHVVSSKDSKHWITLTYGVTLLFLALSSLLMYRPGTKRFKRGVLTAVSGGIASVILLIL